MPLGTAKLAQPGHQDKPLCFPEATIEVVNQSGGALSAGDVRRFNTQFSDGAALPSGANSALSAEEGDFDGIWCVIQNDAADTAAHDSVTLCCVLAEDIASGDHGKAYIRGIVTASVSAVAVATGQGLGHVTGTETLGYETGGGQRIVAIILGASAGAGLRTVLFDGVRGFGRSKTAL